MPAETSIGRFAGDLRALGERSIELIASLQDVGGAYPASPTFRVYRYSWLRDGAFIANAMSTVGQVESADRFWEWCASVIDARAVQIEQLVARSLRDEPIGREEFLPTRYTFGGSDVVDDEQWWEFQLDGYGTWVWGLHQHVQRHPSARALIARCASAVRLTTTYLVEFWHRPCYDWWEEHPDDRHPSTLSCLEAGLRAAIALDVLEGPKRRAADETVAAIRRTMLEHGIVDGHLVKAFGRTDVDASLISCMTPMETIDPSSPVADATYLRVVEDLAPDGVHRYLLDTYFGGGRWVVLAGLVGWHEARTGRTDLAMARLRWIRDQATSDGLLPEQVPALALVPEMVAPWEERWGTVATPLLWSHAMFLTLAHELGVLDESAT